MKMNYCMECGSPLHIREHGDEGLVPYCETCAAFRYPMFNTAVSLIVTDEEREHVLLIRQYGRPHYILVAGYVNQGEDAEDAARRELMEELGLAAESVHHQHPDAEFHRHRARAGGPRQLRGGRLALVQRGRGQGLHQAEQPCQSLPARLARRGVSFPGVSELSLP